MCTSQEILDSDTHNLNAIPDDGCWIRPVFQPFKGTVSTNESYALDTSGLAHNPTTRLTCSAWGFTNSHFGLTLRANGSFSVDTCTVARSVACCKPTPVPAPSASLSLPIGAMGLVELSMLKGSA